MENQDKQNLMLESIDLSTAQFPFIKLILSFTKIYKFRKSSLDIESAYLNAGTPSRNIEMRLPHGWSSWWKHVGKLLKPAYGIIKSGRTWQLVIQN